MWASWTLGKRIGTGFLVAVGLSMIIAAVSVGAVQTLRGSSDRLLDESDNVIEARRLEGLAEEELANTYAFLLTGDTQLETRLHQGEASSATLLIQLAGRDSDADAKARLLELTRAHKDLAAALDQILARHQQVMSAEAARTAERFRIEIEREVTPRIAALRAGIDGFVQHEHETLVRERGRFAQTAALSHGVVLGGAALSILLGVGLAFQLTRGVTRDIGAAVQHVQSSSAELQASATQQATASREQAAATNETTTTIKELVATARQIAESAQRVAQIAEQTAAAARGGDDTVRRAQEALGGIKTQVDLVVTHMLELGKKSQQIGGILDIINELAEQTNILAINATIEAAGAGEVGRRFGVVADEIRKLADRVGGSTKDIRTLIDEVRSAVNTTVMATEQGTKAVDQGIRQVGDVATSFAQIVGMVGTTTEAAREIELSTRQQTTAVEQVNIAMSDVSQAAKETEATSSQTSQTASQLVTLSRSLTRLIRSEAA
jgi:CHASE3 domain sensor protein